MPNLPSTPPIPMVRAGSCRDSSEASRLSKNVPHASPRGTQAFLPPLGTPSITAAGRREASVQRSGVSWLLQGRLTGRLTAAAARAGSRTVSPALLGALFPSFNLASPPVVSARFRSDDKPSSEFSALPVRRDGADRSRAPGAGADDRRSGPPGGSTRRASAAGRARSESRSKAAISYPRRRL
jgi:hypothetical protein